MRRKVNGFSRILVAGGAGFIGSHIVDFLLKQGVEVTVLDNLYSGRLENVAHHEDSGKFHFVRGDIRNFNQVRRAVRDVEAVFNEAAVVGVPRSVEDPILANDVNVGGTLTLLKACVGTKVRRFVQASSASVYGNAKTLPLKEESVPNPVSPYAVSELAAENYAKVFFSMYGLETVCLRYFNVYGPRQAKNAYSGVIPIFASRLIRNQRPTVFGDGEQTRDYVYVDDVVDANMLSLTSEKAIGQVFNIATGVASSLNELIRNLQQIVCKPHLEPVYKHRRPGEIRYSCASIEKARRILGYKPKFSLEKGLKKLVEQPTK